MADQQPEALRLADAICDYSRLGHESEDVAKRRRMKANTDAAAELRRLHAVNAQLLEALNMLAAWNDGEIGSHMDAPYAAEVSRAAIAAAKGEA